MRGRRASDAPGGAHVEAVPPPGVPERRRPRRARPVAMTGGAPTISVEHHPRVAARVRSAKAWGALVAFAVVALASASAGAQPFDVLSRALAAGAAGWIVAWFAAVAVGRAVVRAELDAQTAARAAAAAPTADERA